jgi:hypothetical protein
MAVSLWRAIGVIIAEIIPRKSPEMSLVENDDVVE